MGALAQTVLPFNAEAMDEMLTANAGLALSSLLCSATKRRYSTIAYRPEKIFAINGPLDAPTLKTIEAMREAQGCHCAGIEKREWWANG